MSRIVIAGQASPANLGDQAILQGTLKLIRETIAPEKITLVTRAASQKSVFEASGLDVIPSYPDVDRMTMDDSISKVLKIPSALASPGPLIKAVRESDYVFIAGGGYIYSYRKAAPGLTYMSHFAPVFLAKKYKKPVVFLPQSYGPINSCLAKKLLQVSIRNSKKVFYRENISGDFLKKDLASPPAKVVFMPDHALYLKRHDLVGKASEPFWGQKIIGVTIRPWRVAGRDAEDYGKVLGGALAVFARAEKAIVRIIVQVQDEKQNEGDESISRKLEDRLLRNLPREQVQFCTAQPYFSLEELSKLYDGCHLMVAMRLHSALMSFVLGRPALLTGYQYKALGILKAAGLEELYLGDFYDVTEECLLASLRRLWENYHEVKEKIYKAHEVARHQIANAFQEALR